MNKNKVTEQIEDTILMVDTIEGFDDGDTEQLSNVMRKLNDALEEIHKSDWVSVEDGLPPYGEKVFVTSKMSPDNVFKNRRVESTTVPKDGNDFIILWEGRMARITHWKPIDKLEE